MDCRYQVALPVLAPFLVALTIRKVVAAAAAVVVIVAAM